MSTWHWLGPKLYQTLNPDIQITVTGGGSGTGIASLLNNTVDIANASRQIKEEELEAAHENGVDPVEFVIARDAIAIIVNPENPINELSLEQISDIYAGEINNWFEVGGEKSADRAPFTMRPNFWYPRILSGTGAAPGGTGKRQVIFTLHPAAALFRGNHRRDQPEPQRNRIRWTGICNR